jgi:hypothetical protein
VGTHVSHLLETLDASGETGERRQLLRFMALVHDAFKYQVRDRLPRVGENHHAMRARRFAERFTDDQRLLAAIEFHDRPYALWRKLKRRGKLDEYGFRRMIKRIPEPELFLRFIELDGSTEGKRPEPIQWFREELVRRGLVDAEAASAGAAAVDAASPDGGSASGADSSAAQTHPAAGDRVRQSRRSA